MPADGMSAAVKIRKKGQSARPTSSSLKRLYLFPYVGNVTRAGVSVRFAVWKVAGRGFRATWVSYAADCDFIVCYGGAKLADKHLASTIQSSSQVPSQRNVKRGGS